MRKDIIRKPLTELTLLDRFLFAEAMENPENMQIVLDIILDNELHLRGKPQTEKELRRSTVYRFAKLDVWAEDMDDTLYDTEVQQDNTYNLPKRFRYYQGLIDSQLLEPGETNFNKLNRLYQIMIMPFDLFGYGKYCYTFENQCLEVPELEIKDDVTWIFLNTHGTNEDEVSPELVQLLHYFEHTNDADGSVQDERILELQRNVKSVQENAEVGVRYMQLWEEMAMSRQDGYDEGREAGHQEGYGEGRKAGHQEGYGEGRKVGYGEGREAGYDEGCAKINALAQKLLSDNRMDDFWRATKDLAYQEQLLKEYRL